MATQLQSVAPSLAPANARTPVVFAVERWATYAADAPPLWVRHYKEVALDQAVIPLDMDLARYAELDRLDMLHIVTARVRGNLIGYFTGVVSLPSPLCFHAALPGGLVLSRNSLAQGHDRPAALRDRAPHARRAWRDQGHIGNKVARRPGHQPPL